MKSLITSLGVMFVSAPTREYSSFTKAALGAEGVGSDVTMLIGNGYTKGHAEITLQELRECEALRKIFTELYA